MEETPSKRRRTSPRLSQSGPRDATPSRDEPTGAQRNKRPSFASPTKASLAKHNPQILERRRSASPNKSSPTRPVHRRRPSDAASEQSINDLLTAQLESDAASVPASEVNRIPHRSPGPGSAAPSSSGVVPQVGGTLATVPRRSPGKPIPRPLPPPAPEGEDDLNPFIGHTLRRSPQTGVSIPPRPEPELPPSVPDAVSSTPPRGIHTSSPARWREKSKPLRDSPLKQSLMRPDEAGEKVEPTAKRLFGPRPEKSDVRADTVLGQVSDNPRRVMPYDPNAKKRKRVEKLRDEIRKLEADLKLVEAENDRIRAAQDSGRSLGFLNEKETIGAVQRHLVPGADQAAPRQSELLAKAACNPKAFLSFAQPVRPAMPATTSTNPFEDIKSHYPVQMTAEAELPYLQLFGTFDVSSTVAITAPASDGTLRQRHKITLRSRHAPGFFTSKIEMIVNAMNLAILELRVESLEPAARAELGDFVDQICSGKCNRSMQRNIGILSWAMGDWLRVALQRAMLWAQLDREVAAKNGLSNMATKARRSKARGRAQEDNISKQGREISKSELLRFMGQQSFDIILNASEEANTNSSIRLQWKIGFDWTGEAESLVDICVGVPGQWHHVDTQGALGKLPKLFGDLVKGGEPTEVAIRSVVALLVGQA
ncbi:hypothetical protein NLU13_4335 [Sarocladium strictum]|uniref:Uncharacterized protein n=1 Tax=Sarocladium strictum TaxID=5046 RepID=A0AA39GJB5_SARSR|nr:hypothetical protein NLU13_4335 [Sarocladium strictum]